MVIMEEIEPTLKDTFAFQLLVNHGDATKAANMVAPDNAWYANYIAETWPNDEYVMQVKAKLITLHGEDFFLPSKYDIGRRLVTIMDTPTDVDSKLKTIELYARIFGHIRPNGSVAINNVVNNQNKVLVVPQFGNTELEWEAVLIEQQKKLIADAA